MGGEEGNDPGAKLEMIIETLRMSEGELQACQHETDITKTCRQIIKHLFRDPKERAKMLVSSMKADVLKSIQGEVFSSHYHYSTFIFLEYARLVHPAQSKTSNSVLNNAIGNVFATDKRKYGELPAGGVSSDDEETDEDETS